VRPCGRLTLRGAKFASGRVLLTDSSRLHPFLTRRAPATLLQPQHCRGGAVHPQTPALSPVAQTAYRPPQSFGILPPVIKNLLIINGLVFLAQIAFGGLPIDSFNPINRWFALWPLGTPAMASTGVEMLEVPRFYPWQLITTAFLHGSFGHLLLNMLGLWMFGMRIEHVMGTRRFAIYYFACVLGAGVLQLAVTSAPFLLDLEWARLYATVGASGGVLGVLAAFGLLFPDEPVYLYFFVPVPAKWLVLGLAAMDLYAGVSGSQGGVANFAHLGGMVTGALLVLYWRAQQRRRRASHSA